MKLLVTLAIMVASLSLAGAASACSDSGFYSRASTAVDQEDSALEFFQLNSYAAAEAWALRSWRTMQATTPCRTTYKRFRQYEMNSSGTTWNAVKARRRGDAAGALRLLQQGSHWLDLAAAEQATW